MAPTVSAADATTAKPQPETSAADATPAQPQLRQPVKKSQRKKEEDDDDLECGPTCWAITIGIFAIFVGWIVYKANQPVDPLDSQVVQFERDGVLRTVVWAGRAGGTPVSGPNGRDTDWAIFFYKPYCGACKRVWPAFRALGATTNSSGRLRFGEVNCVRDQAVCAMMGAEKQPLMRLYKATTVQGTAKGGKEPTGFKREVAAEWQGLLIAYEVVNWFTGLQQGEDRLIHESVQWPTEEDLGAAMRRFKARGKTQVETSMTKPPADPAGYLVDAELALVQGLNDHIFPTEAPLRGARFNSLMSWIQLQQECFPRKAVRLRLGRLHSRLTRRTQWERSAFEDALRAQGFATTPPADSEWRWCAPRGHRGGGYPCALWTLFHTTMANSPRTSAADALATIADWVALFFGCAECAMHFGQYYEAYGNDEDARSGHIGAVIWLWRAHNHVSARLYEEEVKDDGVSNKMMWPKTDDCEACFNSTEGGSDGGATLHAIFEYHQEVYCFESDTYVCSGFDDPSKQTSSRPVPTPTPQKGVQKA